MKTATGTDIVGLPSLSSPDDEVHGVAILDPKLDAAFITACEPIAEALAINDQEAALRALSALPRVARRPAQHAHLGELAERAGDLGRAVDEHNLRLSQEPSHLPTLYALARLRLDQGDELHAAACYQKILDIDPLAGEAALEFGRLKEAQGDLKGAIALYHNASTAADTARLASAAFNQGPIASAADEGPSMAAPAEHDPFGKTTDPASSSPIDDLATTATPVLSAPSDSQALTFISLFAGRQGVYARQWVNEGGRTGYTPTHEAFTAEVARRHLLDRYTVGIYPVRHDNTVNFLCFDIDIASGSLRSNQTKERITLLRHCQRVASSIQEILGSVGIPAIIEDSGYKGRHVWIFFAEPIKARAARILARHTLGRIGKLPTHINVELFPAQERVARDRLGNLVKLPLGIHKKSGQRALFLNAEGRPYANQLAVLDRLRRVPTAIVERALEALADPDPPLGDPPGGRDAHRNAGPDADAKLNPDAPSHAQGHLTSDSRSPSIRSTNEASHDAADLAPTYVDITYDLDEDLEVQRVLSACNVLGTLVSEAQRDGEISNEGRLAITHTLGGLTHGAEAVNAILGMLPGFDPRLLLKRRLAGHPTSCAKLRNRLPDLIDRVGCDCPFNISAGEYPTPVLHARDLAVMPAPLAARALATDRLVKNWVTTRTDLDRLRERETHLEAALISLLGEQEIDSLETSFGTLRLHVPKASTEKAIENTDAPTTSAPEPVSVPPTKADEDPLGDERHRKQAVLTLEICA